MLCIVAEDSSEIRCEAIELQLLANGKGPRPCSITLQGRGARNPPSGSFNYLNCTEDPQFTRDRMAANPSSVVSRRARAPKGADYAVVVSSWLAAALLAGSSAAFLGGASALRAWSSWRVGLILYVIPAPDLLFSFVSLTWKSARPDYVHLAILDLVAAVLMVAAAIGIGKLRRWAYWLYSLICLSAIIGRCYTIWKIWAPTYNPRPLLPTPYLVLDAVGIAVALAAAWYASQRALSFAPGQVSPAAKPGGASAPIPWFVVTLSAFVLICVWLRTADVLGHIDSWQARYEMRRAILIAVAYACVLLFGFLRPARRFAGSLALGVAVMGFITVGSFGLSALPQLELAWAFSGGVRASVMFPVWGFLLGNVVLAVAALVSMIRRRTLHVGLVALAVVFVGGIDPALHALRAYDASRTALAEELAGGGPYILYRTENCLLRYKALRPAGFPDSLAQVNDALPGCLQSGLAKGRKIGGYRIEYDVTGPAPRQHFSLMAVPSIHDTQGMISFFADETGVVRTLTGNRLATASDGGVTPAQDFYMMRRCLDVFDRFFGQGSAAASAENRFPQESERFPVSFAQMAPRDRCYLRGRLDGDGWKTAAYRFSYREFAQDSAENFALSARPLQYAVTGLRSYFMDNTFVVHATSEDRDATVNDPVADVCEFLSLVPCGGEQATPARPK